MIRGRYQLKHRRIDWKVIDGPNMGSSRLKQIIQAIEDTAVPSRNGGPQNGLARAPNPRKHKPGNSPSLGERK